MYNGFIGLILLVVAALIFVQPRIATTAHAAVCGAVGLALLAGPLLARSRPAMLPRLLALDGVLLIGLAVLLAGDSVVWALRAPAPSPFRYAPGMVLVPVVYGALQLADPGNGSDAIVLRRKLFRRAGLIAGVIGEVTVAIALLVRASRS